MAGGNWVMFGEAGERLLKDIRFDTDSYRVALVSSSWTPTRNETTWADLSTYEISGTGYSTHGKALTQTVARTNQAITLDWDDQNWPSSTFTAKYAVVVRDADDDGSLTAADVPMLYCDLATGVTGGATVSSATFEVLVNASGAYTLTLATS